MLCSENLHVVFFPNKQRSFESFMCLDLVSEIRTLAVILVSDFFSALYPFLYPFCLDHFCAVLCMVFTVIFCGRVIVLCRVVIHWDVGI